MVGTCIGAGDYARAGHVAWIGAGITFALTEAIGLWRRCGRARARVVRTDPGMLVAGTAYLHAVGPFYGFSAPGWRSILPRKARAALVAATAGLLRITVAVGAATWRCGSRVR